MTLHPATRTTGLALIDCLVYISLMALILGLSFGAFIETVTHSTELERTSLATVQALHAGEQWRQDIRLARSQPQVVEGDGQNELRITTASGEIGYAFREATILRRYGPDAPWLEVLGQVKASRFTEDNRKQVSAWRWDLELIVRKDRDRFRRVFTFQAVPPSTPAP